MSALFRSSITWEPIDCFLNAETETKKDELTKKWRDNKIEELNFVGIVVGSLSPLLGRPDVVREPCSPVC